MTHSSDYRMAGTSAVMEPREGGRTVNGEEDRQEEASGYAESACAGLWHVCDNEGEPRCESGSLPGPRVRSCPGASFFRAVCRP